jgi:hypothetical protein
VCGSAKTSSLHLIGEQALSAVDRGSCNFVPCYLGQLHLAPAHLSNVDCTDLCLFLVIWVISIRTFESGVWDLELSGSTLYAAMATGGSKANAVHISHDMGATWQDSSAGIDWGQDQSPFYSCIISSSDGTLFVGALTKSDKDATATSSGIYTRAPGASSVWKPLGGKLPGQQQVHIQHPCFQHPCFEHPFISWCTPYRPLSCSLSFSALSLSALFLSLPALPAGSGRRWHAEGSHGHALRS